MKPCRKHTITNDANEAINVFVRNGRVTTGNPMFYILEFINMEMETNNRYSVSFDELRNATGIDLHNELNQPLLRSIKSNQSYAVSNDSCHEFMLHFRPAFGIKDPYSFRNAVYNLSLGNLSTASGIEHCLGIRECDIKENDTFHGISALVDDMEADGDLHRVPYSDKWKKCEGYTLLFIPRSERVSSSIQKLWDEVRTPLIFAKQTAQIGGKQQSKKRCKKASSTEATRTNSATWTKRLLKNK